jgi:hypothetical protein
VERKLSCRNEVHRSGDIAGSIQLYSWAGEGGTVNHLHASTFLEWYA